MGVDRASHDRDSDCSDARQPIRIGLDVHITIGMCFMKALLGV